MNSECIHGLGEPAWCTICNGRQAREDAIAWNIKYHFRAKYEGVCTNCFTDILVGDNVAMTEGRGVICGDCE